MIKLIKNNRCRIYIKKIKFKNFFYFLLLLASIIIASWFVINGSIRFYTDVARDFLLLEDIVINKPITLIGPRSSLSGVFHGPLWLYLNLPAFIIGKGNPVIVGWFWVFLYLLSLYVTYQISFLIFKNNNTSIKSTVLMATVFISYVSCLFNPYGAVILFPIFFYIYWRYLLTNDNKYFLFSLFILGLIIQFQIAFGGPIFVLVFLQLIYLIIKRKKPLHHLLSFLIILIPLFTFFLFDIRHSFIQTKSLLSYFAKKESIKNGLISFAILTARLKGLFFEEFIFVFGRNNILYGLFLLNVFLSLKRFFKANKGVYYLFFYFLFGFWFLSLFYRGNIYYYYYLPFIPLIIIFFCSLEKYLNKYFFIATFFLSIFFNLWLGYKNSVLSKNYYNKDSASWKFYYYLATDIFNEKNKEFGYYIFTPDLFGYPVRYGLNYVQKKYQNYKSFPFTKKRVTYLIISPPPGDKPFLNGDWWRENQVKITKKPEKIIRYSNGYRVEKYILSDEEIKISSDPNILQGLYFR